MSEARERSESATNDGIPGFLRAWATEVGDTYVLGLVRAMIGLFLFWHALVLAQNFLRGGYFADAFHMPLLPESLVPSRTAYGAIIAVRLLLAVMVTVGHRARFALFASSISSVYVMLCDRLQLHHNRYALACYAFLLAFTPCDRAFKITATHDTIRSTRIGPLWAMRLVQVQLSLIYIASSTAKLFDPDWREGVVIYQRFVRYGWIALDKGVPSFVVNLLQQPMSASFLAKMAIATELFLAFGLWNRQTRIFALWWGTMFHLTIEATSKVEIFTWLSLTIYALFATPEIGGRTLYFDPSKPSAAFGARVVAALDWLARFQIRPWEPDDLDRGHAIVIIRKDGTHATGLAAWAMVARCIPLFFPAWAPLAFVASFTKKGDASARA